MEVAGVEQLGPREAYARLQAGTPMLDVREPAERQQAAVPGSLWIPLRELRERLDEVPDEVLVMCAGGFRSQQAARFLVQSGRRASNVAHGIQGWARMGLPLETGP